MLSPLVPCADPQIPKRRCEQGFSGLQTPFLRAGIADQSSFFARGAQSPYQMRSGILSNNGSTLGSGAPNVQTPLEIPEFGSSRAISVDGVSAQRDRNGNLLNPIPMYTCLDGSVLYDPNPQNFKVKVERSSSLCDDQLLSSSHSQMAFNEICDDGQGAVETSGMYPKASLQSGLPAAFLMQPNGLPIMRPQHPFYSLTGDVANNLPAFPMNNDTLAPSLDFAYDTIFDESDQNPEFYGNHQYPPG